MAAHFDQNFSFLNCPKLWVFRFWASDFLQFKTRTFFSFQIDQRGRVWGPGRSPIPDQVDCSRSCKLFQVLNQVRCLELWHLAHRACHVWKDSVSRYSRNLNFRLINVTVRMGRTSSVPNILPSVCGQGSGTLIRNIDLYQSCTTPSNWLRRGLKHLFRCRRIVFNNLSALCGLKWKK